MPLELQIENANLSESHFIAVDHGGRKFSGDGQSRQRYLVIASRLLIRAEIQPSLYMRPCPPPNYRITGASQMVAGTR